MTYKDRFFNSKSKWAAYGVGAVLLDRVLGLGLIPEAAVEELFAALIGFGLWSLRDAIKPPLPPTTGGGARLLRVRKPRG